MLQRVYSNEDSQPWEAWALIDDRLERGLASALAPHTQLDNLPRLFSYQSVVDTSMSEETESPSAIAVVRYVIVL